MGGGEGEELPESESWTRGLDLDLGGGDADEDDCLLDFLDFTGRGSGESDGDRLEAFLGKELSGLRLVSGGDCWALLLLTGLSEGDLLNVGEKQTRCLFLLQTKRQVH